MHAKEEDNVYDFLFVNLLACISVKVEGIAFKFCMENTSPVKFAPYR